MGLNPFTHSRPVPRGSWNCNWGGGGGGGGNIVYNHDIYITKNVTNTNITRNNYNNYHPWGLGPHGAAPYGPHPYSPNGQNGYRPTAGNGSRPGDGYRPNGGYDPEPNGGRNGDHGLIGGQGGVQRLTADGGAQHMQDGYDRDRDNSFGANRQRSYMSGNGDRDRAAARRGKASTHPAAMHSRPQHMSAARSSGGGHRR